ncbi:hypothetical protein D3C78_1515300 [compost metagenome]
MSLREKMARCINAICFVTDACMSGCEWLVGVVEPLCVGSVGSFSFFGVAERLGFLVCEVFGIFRSFHMCNEIGTG